MKPFEERAEVVLVCAFYGIHHAPYIKKTAGEFPRWEVNHSGDLSTFDFDTLTRLVVASHDQCIRASIQHSGPRMVKIVLHNRQGREGNMCHRHPTIEQAITNIRASIYGSSPIENAALNLAVPILEKETP